MRLHMIGVPAWFKIGSAVFALAIGCGVQRYAVAAFESPRLGKPGGVHKATVRRRSDSFKVGVLGCDTGESATRRAFHVIMIACRP